MDLFEIDFDKERHERSFRYSPNQLYNDDDFDDMMAQADTVIKNENENTKRRAEACVKKYQLFETRDKLAPKLLEKALELYPDMPQALTSMGRFYLHTKNREKAIEYFNKVVDIDPSYPYVWLEKTSFVNDEEEKIRFYSEFIKLKPDSKIGYEKRGLLYEAIVMTNMEMTINTLEDDGLIFRNTSIIELAINDYSELIRLDPSNWENYERRARMHLKMSKMDNLICGTVFKPRIWTAALMDIEQLMLLYSTESRYCITIVDDLFVDLPEKTTIEYITQIIADLPPNSVAHLIALALLAKRYNYDEREKAIEIYSKIINSLKDGDLLQLYCFYNRAFIFSARKEFEKALSDHAMIIKHGSLLPKENYHLPLEANPYYARENRAGIYKKMNDLTGAINEYTLLLKELNNTDERHLITDAYFKRAGLFVKNGEPDKALADYSAIIDLGTAGIEHSLKDAYAARIKIYKTRGEMDKAFADYIKMSELKNDDSLFCLDSFATREFEIVDE
jgi:tetratricopeptide (TPR) repeat protein